MAAVSVIRVDVHNNPGFFRDEFIFDITFVCSYAIEDGMRAF